MEPNSLSAWFKKNNPLYLLSVMLMLVGLYLAGSEFESGKVSSLAVSGFFLVQNLYELIMVAMALYLLKQKIQPEHGKILLFFVLLFLGDLTFYQLRISGLSATAGWFATLVYMLLAVIKLAAVIKVLGLTVHHTRIFFAGSAFALIWIGPKIAYMLVDAVGRESITYFDGSFVFYSLWLIAGLIHLPLIVENWRSSNLNDASPNEYLGDATSLWRWLIIFPAVVLPVQLFINVMSDSYRFIVPNLPVAAVIAPWLLAVAFLIQSLWRHFFTDRSNLNIYDSAVMIAFLVLVKISCPDLNVATVINHVLLVVGLIVTSITRGNLVNGGVMGLMVVWHGGEQLMKGAKVAVGYGSGLSRLAWAAILMVGSFFMLLAGFLFSISRNGTDANPPATSTPDETELNRQPSGDEKQQQD